MLSAVNGMLASLYPMQEDLNQDGVYDDFWDRFTSDPMRLTVFLVVAVAVGAYMFFKVGSVFLRVLAILVGILAGWAAWGLVNEFFSEVTQPLFTTAISLDFQSFLEYPLVLWWLVPLVGFIAIMTRKGDKGFGRFLLALLVAAGLMLTIMVGQWLYREGKEEAQEQGAPALVVDK